MRRERDEDPDEHTRTEQTVRNESKRPSSGPREPLPPCSDCQRLRGYLGAGDAFREEDFAEFESAEKLFDAFPGRVGDQRVLHSMQRHDVRALYELAEPIACSMRGGHRHNKGLVVETLCKRILFLGLVCGRDVEGFAGGKDFVRQTREHLSRKRLLENAPALERRIDETLPLVRRAHEVQKELTDKHPWLAHDARTKARSKDIRGRQAQAMLLVPGRPGEKETPQLVTREIKGLAFWSGNFDEKKLIEVRRAVRNVIARAAEDLSPRTVKKLADVLANAETTRREHAVVWEHAAAFFADDNLDFFLRALRPNIQGKTLRQLTRQLQGSYRRWHPNTALG